MQGLMGVAPCCACSSQWLLPGFPVLAWLCVMKVWHAILVATDGQECLHGTSSDYRECATVSR